MKKIFSHILAAVLLITTATLNTAASYRPNVIITPDGPDSKIIETGYDDFPLLNLYIDTNTDTQFTKFPLSIEMQEGRIEQGLLFNNGSPNLTDIKVTNSATGEILMGPIQATQLLSNIKDPNSRITEEGNDKVGFYLFNQGFTVQANQPMEIVISADIPNQELLDGLAIRASMYNSSAYPETKKPNTNTWVSFSPRTPIKGAEHKIAFIERPNLDHPIIQLSPSSPHGYRNPAVQDLILYLTVTAQSQDVLFQTLTVDLMSTAAFNTRPLEPIECSLASGINFQRVFSNGYIEFHSPSHAEVTFDIHNDSIIDEEFEIPREATRDIRMYCDTVDLLNLTAFDDMLSTSINLGSEESPGAFHWNFARTPNNIINWVQNDYQGNRIFGGNLRY